MKNLAMVLICGATVLSAQSSTSLTPVLIVDGQNNHDWSQTTPLLKKILEDTGLFRVEVLTTPPKVSIYRVESVQSRCLASRSNG
jgi:hypothetical protein